LECAPAFIMAVDQHGKVQFTNKVPAHSKMEGALGSDLTQDLPVALEPDDQHQARLSRILATGVAETYETTVVGSDGRVLSFATNIGPLRVDDLVAGAVLVTQDVTELKRT
jgi:PAS domain S-box-containing protein